VTRVHLHEIERPVAVEQKFHRSCADIADSLCRRDGGIAHFHARFRRQARRGRFFQHLLMAPLDGTITLEQINRIAFLIGKNLNFHMARARQVFFDQHMIVAEGRLRLALGCGQRFRKTGGVFDHAHAFAATARRGLDQHGITDFLRFRRQKLFILLIAVITRHQRHARLFHQGFRIGFAAHGANGRNGRADENQACGGDRFGKILVLRQKAVTGMDGIRARAFGDIDDFCRVQIAFPRRGRADRKGFIGHFHMQRTGIGIGINRHGGDPHVAAGMNNAAGDFAAVGDQDFLNRHGSSSIVKQYQDYTRSAPAYQRRTCGGKSLNN